MRVLVVDDSVTFRSLIKKALEGIDGIEVVGAASNGRIALDMIEQKNVEIVTLDLNMPEMDGLQFLEKLGPSRLAKLRVIVFAGRTEGSARDTVKALSLGAKDFIFKPDSDGLDWDSSQKKITSDLVPKIRQLATEPSSGNGHNAAKPAVPVAPVQGIHYSLEDFTPAAIVVASSTGGPQALETFFKHLGPPISVPILVAQHMPEKFTNYLAQRIQEVTKVECREGLHNEAIRPGTIYVAPGNYHMRVVGVNGLAHIILDQEERINGVRPAADYLFETAADFYGKQCMAFVLTGMGRDGCAGAEQVRKSGGRIMIQDKESSVVWGMPGSVFDAGCYDRVGNLQECGGVLARMSMQRSIKK